MTERKKRILLYNPKMVIGDKSGASRYAFFRSLEKIERDAGVEFVMPESPHEAIKLLESQEFDGFFIHAGGRHDFEVLDKIVRKFPDANIRIASGLIDKHEMAVKAVAEILNVKKLPSNISVRHEDAKERQPLLEFAKFVKQQKPVVSRKHTNSDKERERALGSIWKNLFGAPSLREMQKIAELCQRKDLAGGI